MQTNSVEHRSIVRCATALEVHFTEKNMTLHKRYLINKKTFQSKAKYPLANRFIGYILSLNTSGVVGDGWYQNYKIRLHRDLSGFN